MTDPKGYGQFCPVAMTAEILTAKWTPLIIRELMLGPARFNDLRRGVPRMSQSLLTRRLGELEHYEVIAREALPSGGYEYALTEMGESLAPLVELMGLWGSANLRHKVTESELDPNLLFWDIRRSIEPHHFPKDKKTIIHFEITGVKKNQKLWWIVCEEVGTDLCIKDPGSDPDLVVYATLEDLTKAWAGHEPLKDYLSSGRIRLEGTAKQKTLFPKWFRLSPFANKKTNERLSIQMRQTGKGLEIWSTN